MNRHDLTLCGARLTALSGGALWWAEEGMLIVSDLHLGKSRRAARRGGAMLPPYEVRETLERLSDVLMLTSAATVISLGDSFDDARAEADLAPCDREHLSRLMRGRRWISVEGNHDPSPTAVREFTHGPLTFRHIALPGAEGEVSGHYHPKVRLSLGGAGLSRPCFLADGRRIILPAFGTYTGGLDWRSRALGALMGDDAVAVLTGGDVRAIPMPRRAKV